MATKDRTPAEVLAILATCTFRAFTREDWYAWAGCESKNPFYGETTDPMDPKVSLIVILDGDTVSVMDLPEDPTAVTDDGQNYVLRYLI